MTQDIRSASEQARFEREIRSNPLYRGKRFKDMPRHRKFEIYSSAAGSLLVFMGGLLLAAEYNVGYICIASGVFAYSFLAIPYIFAFLGYWFPRFTLWAAKLDHWLEKDFKE